MKTLDQYEELVQKIKLSSTEFDPEKNPYLVWLNSFEEVKLGEHLSYTFYIKSLIEEFYKSE